VLFVYYDSSRRGSYIQLFPGQQERLREAFGQQKWLATRASTITQQQEMNQVRSNRHKQQPTINGDSNTGGGWQQCHLRAAVNDWQQRPAMRETTAAMDDGGCWCLMVVMDGMMKIAMDVGNGQRRGEGQMTVQCWGWVATV
jgi:hypothetical protein